MGHFSKAINIILKHEGGLVNDPDDPGGITNFGLSIKFMKARGIDVDGDGDVDPDDILALTKATASEIYCDEIWGPGGFDSIGDFYVATKIFDMDVNMGHERAVKIAQTAANAMGAKLDIDGDLGPKTIQAINSFDPTEYMVELKKAQVDFYQNLVVAKPKLKKFLPGWLKRASWPA